MRIANRESLEFRTHIAPVGYPAGMLASVSFDATDPLSDGAEPSALKSAASATGLFAPRESEGSRAAESDYQPHLSVSEVKQDHPLNLSISLSGGKENNNHCLSSGERTGKSPSFKSAAPGTVEL